MTIIKSENGKSADVGDLGLHTYSAVYDENVDSARRDQMYTITSAYTTGGADEEVIYLKNTHATSNLELVLSSFGTAVSGVFTVYKVTGTAGGASAITAVNARTGSTIAASVSATGNASVTGLTLGDVIGKTRVLANDSKESKLTVVVSPNTAIAVSNSATGACDVTLSFHFPNADS